jgi:hypothetical protein
MDRLIDADALFEVVRRHHDLYKGVTNPADKARRDECLQVMCDINDAPTIDAIPMDWMDAQIRGYASRLQSTELKALVLVKQMWEREQEAR